MCKAKMLLVNQKILPPVFGKVLKAKQYILSGEAQSTSDAVKRAGISRSTFYKYKDYVYFYNEYEKLITIQATLQDTPGVLMKFTSAFYDVGANILTINQNIPVMGLALISISAKCDLINTSIENFIETLKNIKGVKKIENISNN